MLTMERSLITAPNVRPLMWGITYDVLRLILNQKRG